MEVWKGIEAWHFGHVAIERVRHSWRVWRYKCQLDSCGGTD
jgi:hypothetical protein